MVQQQQQPSPSRTDEQLVRTHGINLGSAYRSGLISRLGVEPSETLLIAAALDAWSLYVTADRSRAALDTPYFRRIFIESFVTRGKERT